MGIKKTSEKCKGTIRVSFGDRKLMSRLYIAEKNNRYEKRRQTRQISKKEKECLTQGSLYRGKKGCQIFLKQVKTPIKKVDIKEDDEDVMAVDTMSRVSWYMLTTRNQSFQDDCDDMEKFLKIVSDKEAKKLGSKMQSMSLAVCTEEKMPLFFAKKNMRLMHQYKRIRNRREQVFQNTTTSSSYALVQHMFHSNTPSGIITPSGNKNTEYCFSTGGLISTAGLWPLLDNQAPPPRLYLQKPCEEKLLGDVIPDTISSKQYENHKKKVNQVEIHHLYEAERNPDLWTTCQKCREPLNTREMIVRESLGIEDVACFHPYCSFKTERFHNSNQNQVKNIDIFFKMKNENDVRSGVKRELNSTVEKASKRRQMVLQNEKIKMK